MTTLTATAPIAGGTGLSNGRLGMMLLVGTETILFATFISAYMILRMGAGHWPPAGTPAMTIGLSAVNTALLVLSSVLAIRKQLLSTFIAGVLFVSLQVVEFSRLFAKGLTLQSGVYGALFYSLITCHALHVLGGLIFLAIAMRKSGEWIGHAQLYWHFVTGVWLVLFSILYII